MLYNSYTHTHTLTYSHTHEIQINWQFSESLNRKQMPPTKQSNTFTLTQSTYIYLTCIYKEYCLMAEPFGAHFCMCELVSVLFGILAITTACVCIRIRIGNTHIGWPTRKARPLLHAHMHTIATPQFFHSVNPRVFLWNQKLKKKNYLKKQQQIIQNAKQMYKKIITNLLQKEKKNINKTPRQT